MPNPDLTHIVFVLDRSGSMDPLRHAAVDGFNEFLTRQRSLPGLATVTLIQFSGEVSTTWGDCLPRMPPCVSNGRMGAR